MQRERGEYVTPEQLKQVITNPGGQPEWNLKSHDGSGSDIQQVSIALELNDNDFANLEFLFANADQLNQILE